MYDERVISIMRLANGFLVSLPDEPQGMRFPDFTDPEVIKGMARTMRDEMQEDPLLSDLKAEQAPEQKKQKKRSFMPPEQKNLFIFSTWYEVVDFLGALT